MMTLFSGADDAHSHRVRIVLAAKGLAVRVLECDPAHPPEDLIDLNPFQSLPTLTDRDLVVYGPGIISEYIDERFPAPALMPGDPAGRAQARIAAQRIELDWYGLVPQLESDDRRELQRARRLLLEAVTSADSLLRVKPWFLSDHFSMLDAAVAPILWRLPRWGVALPPAAPHVERYCRRLFAHPALRASLTPVEREMRE